ncbi:unnamed protein product [Protopolystoma xenopodis]|uniref:Uncharacterized protein n=1 Tax=Protopolystoma xenopodis TaxID=117903 RepID=A0A3S5FDE5_9PLAT|nr:unnamed protein product [Protopolystoma xenopodis]
MQCVPKPVEPLFMNDFSSLCDTPTLGEEEHQNFSPLISPTDSTCIDVACSNITSADAFQETSCEEEFNLSLVLTNNASTRDADSA